MNTKCDYEYGIGGFMEKLDAKYILVNDGKCPEKDMSPATLGLTNMAGSYCYNYNSILGKVKNVFIQLKIIICILC